MTTAKHINNTVILTTLLRNKAFNPIMKQYGINYNCITMLLACYCFITFVADSFTFYSLYKFINYYRHPRMVGYINKLVNIGLISLAGKGHYKLTPEGLQVIQTINDNMNHSMYLFCDKFNIDL